MKILNFFFKKIQGYLFSISPSLSVNLLKAIYQGLMIIVLN